MADARVQRRLAAILAADVAGYSRLMGNDEEGTLAALKACRRELTDPKVAEHHGRIVKTTGDGTLAEFASAVDAVRCAVEIQRAIAEHNTAIPDDRRIEFRIGINVGDILIDEGDIYGDGVNIAARLEALASPGAICLSEDAYNQIKNKLTLNVSDMGEQRLKNIAEPIRVYNVRLDDAVERPTLALPDKPSIAVLPFQNMSGDPEQEYFADGMVEEIITALSRIRWLFVIARNSSFIYKGRAPVRAPPHRVDERRRLDMPAAMAMAKARPESALMPKPPPTPEEWQKVLNRVFAPHDSAHERDSGRSQQPALAVDNPTPDQGRPTMLPPVLVEAASVLAMQVEEIAQAAIARIKELLAHPFDRADPNFAALLRFLASTYNTSMTTIARTDDTRLKRQAVSRLDTILERVAAERIKRDARRTIEGATAQLHDARASEETPHDDAS